MEIDLEKRKSKILELYEHGDTLQSIAIRFGVSRQRIWQIAKPSITHSRKSDMYYNGIKSTPSEKLVFNKLKKNNIKFIPMAYNHPFDVLINDKKVEIKHKSNPVTIHRGQFNYKYYSFFYLKDLVPVDFYIFVCGHLGKNAKCYVYSAREIGNSRRIPAKAIYAHTKKKLYQHFERWDMIK